MLNRTDADVTLMMLNQNIVKYLAPSDDPWMPAHIPFETPLLSGWFADYYATLMGCVDQYQFCNPNKDNGSSACTKLSGKFTVMRELLSPKNAVNLNAYQLETATRVAHPLAMTMHAAVTGRDASALNGQSTTS